MKKLLLVFSLFLVSVGGGQSRTVTGYSGGGVLFKCRYDRRYTSNPKYLCKDSSPDCVNQIRTGVKNEWVTTGRFSLFDNTGAAEFWVMIRELTVEDSGMYRCGVDSKGQQDVYTPVELTVEKDKFSGTSISESRSVGGSMNISCKYPQSHSSDPKFLCRRVGYVGCSYKSPVKESRRWIKVGQFSLYDDRADQIFTASINSLSERDSGEYWCGAESDWTSDEGYKVYFTQVNLRVTEEAPTTTLSSSPSTSPRVTTGHSLLKTTLLNEETPTTTLSSSSPSTSPSITTGSSLMKTSSSITLFPVITVVSVIVVMFLIGLFILAVWKRLRPKESTLTPTQPPGGSSNNKMDSVVVYENMKDTAQLVEPDAGVSTVHLSAQPPTNPDDPSHPSPRDFSDPIYFNSKGQNISPYASPEGRRYYY